MYRYTLTRGLASALVVSLASISSAVEPAQPSSANPTSKAPRRVGVESASQANARKMARAKLDIPKGTVATPAAGAAATIDSLSTMLENMGYEPKIGAYDDGSKYLTVLIPRDTWNFGISFDVYSSTNTILLSSGLGQVNNQDKIKASALLNLLEANSTLAPSYFTYLSSTGTLYMYRSLNNADIKPAVLRTALDAFMNSIQDSSNLWDQSTWTAAAPAAPSAPATK